MFGFGFPPFPENVQTQAEKRVKKGEKNSKVELLFSWSFPVVSSPFLTAHSTRVDWIFTLLPVYCAVSVDCCCLTMKLARRLGKTLDIYMYMYVYISIYIYIYIYGFGVQTLDKINPNVNQSLCSKNHESQYGPNPTLHHNLKLKFDLMGAKFCLEGTQTIEIRFALFNYMLVRYQVVSYI